MLSRQEENERERWKSGFLFLCAFNVLRPVLKVCAPRLEIVCWEAAPMAASNNDGGAALARTTGPVRVGGKKEQEECSRRKGKLQEQHLE